MSAEPVAVRIETRRASAARVRGRVFLAFGILLLIGSAALGVFGLPRASGADVFSIVVQIVVFVWLAALSFRHAADCLAGRFLRAPTRPADPRRRWLAPILEMLEWILWVR